MKIDYSSLFSKIIKNVSDNVIRYKEDINVISMSNSMICLSCNDNEIGSDKKKMSSVILIGMKKDNSYVTAVYYDCKADVLEAIIDIMSKKNIIGAIMSSGNITSEFGKRGVKIEINKDGLINLPIQQINNIGNDKVSYLIMSDISTVINENIN